MNLPIPEHHSNPETFKDEPVFIFENKAVVPPPRAGLPSKPDGQVEKSNPAGAEDQPAEGS